MNPELGMIVSPVLSGCNGVLMLAAVSQSHSA